jgi:hypothetical protein
LFERDALRQAPLTLHTVFRSTQLQEFTAASRRRAQNLHQPDSD